MDDSREYYLFKDCDQLYHAPKPLEKFYFELGCKRLGDLIQEEYLPSGPELYTNKQKQRAEDCRKLVLQRLMLYIQTFDDKDLEAKRQQMYRPEYFTVTVFPGLRVKRLLNFAGNTWENTSDVSCGYWSNENDSFDLLLTTNEPDYFEQSDVSSPSLSLS